MLRQKTGSSVLRKAKKTFPLMEIKWTRSPVPPLPTDQVPVASNAGKITYDRHGEA